MPETALATFAFTPEQMTQVERVFASVSRDDIVNLMVEKFREKTATEADALSALIKRTQIEALETAVRALAAYCAVVKARLYATVEDWRRAVSKLEGVEVTIDCPAIDGMEKASLHWGCFSSGNYDRQREHIIDYFSQLVWRAGKPPQVWRADDVGEGRVYVGAHCPQLKRLAVQPQVWVHLDKSVPADVEPLLNEAIDQIARVNLTEDLRNDLLMKITPEALAFRRSKAAAELTLMALQTSGMRVTLPELT